jgi:predicted permease
MWSRLRSLASAALGRQRFEREMEEELLAHLRNYTEDLVARGLPRELAQQRAHREFGPVQSAKDGCRDARGLRWPDEIARDVRYALRLLRKSPTFTFTAIATLALCIGANTALFSVVDAVLFRPLPYPQPDRLATVIVLHRGAGGEYEQMAQDGRNCEIVREHARSLEAAVHSGGGNGVNFVSGNNARYVRQQRVSAGFFRVLGVHPWIGREFTAAEDRPGGPALAILSHALWQNVLGADPKVVGRKITLRGEPYTVIGVMPEGFRTNVSTDVWTPLRPTVNGEGGGTNYHLIARIRPGISWDQANAELASLSQSAAEDWRLRPGRTAQFHLLPLKTGQAAEIRTPLLILWAAVGLTLLAGCVNLASLLLARSAARQREIATRIALGSGRWTVVRQLLVESLLLACGGGLAGCTVGYLALQGLKTFALKPLGISEAAIGLDARVLAATAAATILTGLLFGLYPALATTRVDIRSSLAQGGSHGGSGRNQSWPRRALVVAEVGLAAVLLVAAGLLIRTFSHLTGLDPGFDGHNVRIASLSLQDARYATSAKVNRLFDASLEQIRRIPGVQFAGVGLTPPYRRALNSPFFRLDGPHVSGEMLISNVTYVTPGYLEALRIELLRGRTLTAADTAQSQPVALVNQAFVRKYFPEQEPVGSHIRMDTVCEVVGVVADVQQSAGWGQFGPVGAVPAIYVPATQVGDGAMQMVHTWFSPVWVIRTAGPVRNLGASLAGAVRSVNPLLPFAAFETMDEIREEAFARQRMNALLMAALAGLALLLAATGIYGLIAQSVMERTRELGIRMALGATRSQAIGAVSRAGLTLVLAGLLLGSAAALASARVLKMLIWGIAPNDPVAFAGACGTLLLAGAVAVLLPSLRIVHIHPAQTLREE